MWEAVRAGLLAEEDYRDVMAGLPRSFAFLETRRIQAGDRVRYRIRGDVLRTVYIGVDGDLLLDQIDRGPERRMSVLGTFLGPRSGFRDGLIESLFDPDA